MFLKFLKKIPVFFIISRQLLLMAAIESLLLSAPLLANTILVTNSDSGEDDGSLGAAILAAGDGDTIDCSPIAGQTIGLGNPLPAIGHNFASSTSSLTIFGSGVTIDGQNV